MRLIIVLFGLVAMSCLATGKTLDLISEALTVQTYDPVSLLKTANKLIALGNDGAYQTLQQYANGRGRDDKEWNNRSYYTAWLSVLVYRERTPGSRRSPEFGAPDFPLLTDNSQWPLFPLVFSDRTPFLLVSGYSLGGLAEPGASYVEYCRKHGIFRNQPYPIPSHAEAENALNELLVSKRWKSLSWANYPMDVNNKIEFLKSEVQRIK